MSARAFLVWLALLVVAILNGALREAFLNPRLGAARGHLASTILLCAAILVLTWLSIGWIGARTVREGALVGLLWVVLTLAFEFLAGHYLFGQPWETLLADYNILAGRVWIVVLLTTFLAPVYLASQRTTS